MMCSALFFASWVMPNDLQETHRKTSEVFFSISCFHCCDDPIVLAQWESARHPLVDWLVLHWYDQRKSPSHELDLGLIMGWVNHPVELWCLKGSLPCHLTQSSCFELAKQKVQRTLVPKNNQKSKHLERMGEVFLIWKLLWLSLVQSTDCNSTICHPWNWDKSPYAHHHLNHFGLIGSPGS